VQKKNNDANYINCDVRNKIDIKVNKNVKNIIFNLAAIHTTPGHEDLEYFETNIKGAKNICKFAESNSIDTIIFTSSISPYGSSEIMKNEDSLPTPNTPYGISKLVAEHVHCQWQSREPNKRKLIILRPGVVFGTSENGNFSRLYKMMSKNIFFYAGRKNTKKACIYVKDLVEAMVLMEEKLSTGAFFYRDNM
jgi:nucleoside-diphosphate-sugar epimerase